MRTSCAHDKAFVDNLPHRWSLAQAAWIIPWPEIIRACCPDREKPRTMAAVVEGYCVKCKAKRNMKDAGEVTMANGRKAMKGKCPVCGTGMFKIMGKA